MVQKLAKGILPSVKAFPSLREMAYKGIKNAIMSNQLKRGEFYSEQGLASQFGISKTPVHEAILDLESRGFVTLVARKGIKVNDLTVEDIHALYQFRLVIEAAAIRLVNWKVRSQDSERLRAVHQNCIKATKANDHLEYRKWDRDLHNFLVSKTQNSYLVSALENIRDLIDWMGVRAMYRPNRLAEVDKEHGKILEMIEKGDAETAAKSMEKHIQATERSALAGWEKDQ